MSKLVKKFHSTNGNNLEFDLPLYIPPFELRRMPTYTIQVIQEFLNENKYLIETYKTSTLTNGVPNLTGLFCHSGSNDKKKLKHLMRFYLCNYYQDDEIDINFSKTNNKTLALEMFEILKKIFNNEEFDYGNFPTVFKLWFDSFYEISRNYTNIQRKRFMKYITYYFRDIFEETSLMNGEKSQEDVKPILFDIKPGSEGLGYRNRGIGFTVQLNEFALGIEIKEAHWNDEIFQDFINLCCRSIVLYNDIMSFRKEFIEANGRLEISPNLVAYYATQPGYTLQDAVDNVFEIIQQTDNRIASLRIELKFKYQNEADLVSFIDETVNIIKNGWIYHLGNERYFGKLDDFPPLFGHFIFDQKRTIIVSPDDYNKEKFSPYQEFMKQFYNFQN